jgi:hypothetical protein
VPTKEFCDKAISAQSVYKPFFDIFPLPTPPYTAGAITGTFVGANSQEGVISTDLVRAERALECCRLRQHSKAYGSQIVAAMCCSGRWAVLK